MQLLTKTLEKRFAQVGSQENDPDPIVIAKFFSPVGAATWWCTEYYPEDRVFFGYATLGMGDECDEWGYVSLDELQSIKLPFGLRIERDMYCGEKRISEHNTSLSRKL